MNRAKKPKTVDKVTIIGAGEIGQAIGKILKTKAQIDFWDKDPKKVKNQKTLADAVKNANFLFFCVNAGNIREAATSAKPYINKKTIIVSLAKGLEEKTWHPAAQILSELLPDNRLAALGGPMLAEELKKGLPGFGLVGTKDTKTFKELSKLFSNTKITIWYADDINGIALAGVLKNIYAIALGIAQGLSWGDNQKGTLVAAAVMEMNLILRSFGAKPELAFSFAGLGDLVATGSSPNSLNREVGIYLGKGKSIKKPSEGYRALPGIIKLLKGTKNLPILNALEKIILKKQAAKKVFAELMA